MIIRIISIILVMIFLYPALRTTQFIELSKFSLSIINGRRTFVWVFPCCFNKYEVWYINNILHMVDAEKYGLRVARKKE